MSCVNGRVTLKHRGKSTENRANSLVIIKQWSELTWKSSSSHCHIEITRMIAYALAKNRSTLENALGTKSPDGDRKNRERKKTSTLLALSPIRNVTRLLCVHRARPPSVRDPCRVSVRKCHLPLYLSPSLSFSLRVTPMCRRRSVKGGRDAGPSSQPGLVWTSTAGRSVAATLLCFAFLFFSALVFHRVTTSLTMLTSRGNEASKGRPRRRRPVGGRAAVEE